MTLRNGYDDPALHTENEERILNEANSRPRVSWPGIFVGLVAGLAILITLSALGVAFGAGASSIGGLAIGALIWTAVSIIIAAYLAGFTAVRAGNQGLATRGQFTGAVTGMLMALALVVFLGNAISGLVGTAGSLIGTVAGGAATATAAAGSAAASNPAVQNGVQNILGNLGPEQIGQIISDNDPQLSQAQSTAAANVVSGIITRASNDLGNNLSSVTDLSGFVTSRVDSIKTALSGQDFVTRLQRQGLTQQQAVATQTAITSQVNQLETQATQAAAAAERIARKTASTAGWGTLLALGLVIGAATLGGNQASSTRSKIDSARS